MSLAIDIDKVTAVMIGGVWHVVIEDSFAIDSFEFVQGDRLEFGGGRCELISASGFSFKGEDSQWVSGPLNTIQAVKSL